MSISSPISDSLLPYISKSHDYKSAWRMIKIILPFVLVGGTIGFVWADQIITFIFGAQYLESADVLRAVIPIIAVTPINYIIAFPVMVPMGLQKQSNLANIVGAIVYVLGMLVLWITQNISILSAAIVLMITECCVAGWRTLMVIKYRDRLNADKEGQ
jgi:PST family polysaccharide transporter